MILRVLWTASLALTRLKMICSIHILSITAVSRSHSHPFSFFHPSVITQASTSPFSYFPSLPIDTPTAIYSRSCRAARLAPRTFPAVDVRLLHRH
ncbi:hypothetical protein F5148DRAFT_1167887 [Russula earlei]|uniref:Uncharacterized protein n=1 Tax=Russula earlei TaxID=71964 RepID=A0ACC0UL84_9AGAM|nr:hypothetical protein F5148DRAFT_1167887 [Russula earlei]